ncbi:MAG: hypothetical protein KBE65_11300 [Phycisphaerae bacterium]|nr:hypothetical protein [Phycisphaerae bacterium]
MGKNGTTVKLNDMDRRLLEMEVSRISDSLIAYTLLFRRRILEETLKRIPLKAALEEKAEIDAQMSPFDKQARTSRRRTTRTGERE